MSSRNIQFKVYYLSSKPITTRRFTGQVNMPTCIMDLKSKLIEIFPDLRNANYEIYWKDEADDLIEICSNDELTIALRDQICPKVLWVCKKPQPYKENLKTSKLRAAAWFVQQSLFKETITRCNITRVPLQNLKSLFFN